MLWMEKITPVDAVGLDQKAFSFTHRSIKKETKLWGLLWAIGTMDLTTLAGADTPGKVKQLCGKARRPVPGSMTELFADNQFEIPSVAAVCVYPNFVKTAIDALKGTSISVAAVATAFPSGQLPLNLKLEEVRRTVDLGAHEIDMVINRGAFLSGDYEKVAHEIRATKEACGPAHLKVILETGELGTYDNIAKASHLAMDAGADFIKTSTGKVAPAATLPVTLLMLQCIGDHYQRTGKRIGMKPAGGIRTAKQALQYMCLVNETLGPDWLTPKLWRFGASSLLNDVLRQIFKQKTGMYFDDESFSKD